MAKKVLCVDLGNVLFKFDSSPLKKLMRRPVGFQGFLENCEAYDAGQVDLWDFFCRVKHYFKNRVYQAEFLKAYSDCLVGTHYPMFYALLRLKEAGRARLACITDNNPFCMALTAIKSPEIFELFREGDRDQFIISYRLRSLKKFGNPFIQAYSEFGFSPGEAAYVDDVQKNLDAAVDFARYDRDACFLYKIGSMRNHAQFLKFLDKYFPA